MKLFLLKRNAAAKRARTAKNRKGRFNKGLFRLDGFQDGVKKISSEAFLIGVLSAEPEGYDEPDQDGPGDTYDEWQARWEEDCPDG